MRRLRRAVVSEGLFRGKFPPELQRPEIDETARERVRGDADEVAAQILRVSVRSIQAARMDCLSGEEVSPLGTKRQGKAIDTDTWEELMAFLPLLYREVAE